MQSFDKWLEILKVIAPILVAAVTIIPSIISNRKKTEASLQAMETKIMDDINETKQEVESVKKNFKSHIDEYEETKAKQSRYRILRFYDEVCDNVDHSESHWEDILDDVDSYEKFCDTHKNFKNNRGKDAMEYLNEKYKRLKAKGAFLIHKGE